MNREQIINQYISVYEGHAMEEEELEIMLNGLADDIVNNLQPSLPSNLDEAAEEYRKKSYNVAMIPPIDGPTNQYGGSIKDAFKSGAEWMAKQLLLPEDSVAFQKGVQEGRRLEKEDALTIADIEKLHTFLYAVKNNKHGAFTFTRLTDEQYEEVLRRFNSAKEK